MSLDPTRVADTAIWLSKAQNDIRAAELLLPASPPLYDEIAFHCQQSIEKSFKAFLYWHEQPFQKTHDLNVIGNSCRSLNSSLASLVETALPLTQYAVDYRYPGPIEELSKGEVEEMLALAKTILQRILDLLPPNVAAQLK